VTCINKPFKEVLAMIKLPERPFHITFTWPTVATISVNFTKPGSLGLKFTHNRVDERTGGKRVPTAYGGSLGGQY
jgi:hypothetical protein